MFAEMPLDNRTVDKFAALAACCGFLAEMPLDNRTVDKFAALAACCGFLRPFETSPPAKRLIVSSRLMVL